MRIRKSNRGLTFSFAENEHFKVGSHYRYIVDVERSEVIIIADENGKYKLSRKGTLAKPLVDLRNEEIKEAMSFASYMEIEMADDQIIVHIIKKTINVETTSDIDVADLFDRSETVSFSISKEALTEHNEALTDMLTASGLFCSPEQAYWTIRSTRTTASTSASQSISTGQPARHTDITSATISCVWTSGI